MTQELNAFHKELLKDDREALKYLNAAMALGPDFFLLAMRNVARARRGMRQLALDSGFGVTSAYRMLSKTGNPAFKNVEWMLVRLGFRLQIVRKEVP